MNKQKMRRTSTFRLGIKLLVLGTFLGMALPTLAAPPAPKPPAGKTTIAVQPVERGAMELAPHISVALNKSTVLVLPDAAKRVSVGNAEIADVLLLNPKEIYLLGKKIGTTNIIFWNRNDRGTVIDVSVGVDSAALQGKLKQLLPSETSISVTSSADSVVLGGTVTDAFKVGRAIAIAESFAGNKKVVNLMQVTAPQQVMLEVKIAEVSKNILDRLGANLNLNHPSVGGGAGWQIAGGFLTNSAGLASLFKPGATSRSLSLDAADKDEVIKILAEPNIIAVSGQEGSFLAGGKIFIPVPQGSAGALTITLEEKEFGIGLRFTPTVLEGGRINLRVTPEVSELNQNGIVISAVGIGNTVLPSITTRRASTTVQLNDGQTFAIGGLIKSNVTETVNAFPGLGEIPILGALFRSSEFRRDRTELLFVVTPHLVKPLPPDYKLPTDSFIEPAPGEFFLGGKMEGGAAKPAESQAPKSGAGKPGPQGGSSGFEMK